MNIKTDLIKNYIIDAVNSRIFDFEIDADSVADSTAITVLGEIQKIVQNTELTDFEIVEEIVLVFSRYNLDFGTQHDF
ncbi:MAG: hypothetical protein Q4A86_01050 [Clostridia bacterium]|nr:hypothetical protein [Clostridia bacterium]